MSQIGYFKLLITRGILSGPLDFEIKRVACITQDLDFISIRGSPKKSICSVNHQSRSKSVDKHVYRSYTVTIFF